MYVFFEMIESNWKCIIATLFLIKEDEKRDHSYFSRSRIEIVYLWMEKEKGVLVFLIYLPMEAPQCDHSIKSTKHN